MQGNAISSNALNESEKNGLSEETTIKQLQKLQNHLRSKSSVSEVLLSLSKLMLSLPKHNT